MGSRRRTCPPGEGEELLAELTELVENLGLSVVRATLVKLRSPSPALFLGKGKAEELVAAAKADGAEVIVFDSALSPAQQRNWEEIAGIAVIDRQEVILEVFADRAHTREAVLQVALARMEYSLPRLTRAWTHLSRQRGRGAMGGEGETQLEQDRRVVRDRIAHLKEELAAVVRHRGVQRTRRVRVPLPTASIVGYTNAGKSSLLNRLTGSHVLVEDKLFATLDPTTRQLVLPGNQKLLLTDTVGFIRRLPHGLVEAFKATLEEVLVADFLIHVVDITSPHFEKHRATTLSVLAELGAGNKPALNVFNKVDLADEGEIRAARQAVPDALLCERPDRQGSRRPRGPVPRDDRPRPRHGPSADPPGPLRPRSPPARARPCPGPGAPRGRDPGDGPVPTVPGRGPQALRAEAFRALKATRSGRERRHGHPVCEARRPRRPSRSRSSPSRSRP